MRALHVERTTARPLQTGILVEAAPTTRAIAVIDFDASLRNPPHPARIGAHFDSGDHLHPNDEGNRVMAETVDLEALPPDVSLRRKVRSAASNCRCYDFLRSRRLEGVRMPALSNPEDIVSDPRYARVRARDAAADGEFVYAVGTTGVFCRPSCATRPAKPENMAFYATPEAAMVAGFRACKRCKPIENTLTDAVAAKVWMIADHIAAHAHESLTLKQLATVAGLSPFHLQRTFKAVTGVSPKQYHAAKRLRSFKAGLRAGNSVLDAVLDAGYGSTSRVYDQVDGGLGMTPSAYRAGGAGETIVHAAQSTPLGLMMMAATERGVCFVQFDESVDLLLKQLACEFPKAELRPARMDGNAALHAWMEALDAHLSRGAPRPDLPLDLRGTAFQIRVWRFLLGVRCGSVVSYADVARGIGVPRAVRAAASACAANRVGVLVPCHRALRGDGGLGGYRWGLDRKRVLLERERGDAPGRENT